MKTSHRLHASVSSPPGSTAHSRISPVRELNAAITFFSVATTNFLDPGENSKEANLSFPTYCCLLRKSAGGGGGGVDIRAKSSPRRGKLLASHQPISLITLKNRVQTKSSGHPHDLCAMRPEAKGDRRELPPNR